LDGGHVIRGDEPEMMITALMIEGKTLIPAFSIAITKGDAEALFAPDNSCLLLKGTSHPITTTPPT
jgi:hypothetical protein